MKCYSDPISEHEEVPLADDGQLEDIISHWDEKNPFLKSREQSVKNLSYVLSVGYNRDSLVREAQLSEIIHLVEAQGDLCVDHEIYFQNKSIPSTLIGKGIIQAVSTRAIAAGANLLVIDAELTPSQMRNIEDIAGIPVCDREAVILNVFLKHAKTRRAKIQVEIAQLEYLRPRIRGVGINMDQQAGGITAGRGPGETASELLARKLDDRLSELKKAKKKLERSGKTQRKQRQACKRIVLVGYTNAGKTCLMNGLTSETLSSRDMPFETLDTTSRSLSRHGGDVLISDTVGFIRRLPASLLASFESTLAEMMEASLIVVVVDVSDPEWQLHIETTHAILGKLGVSEVSRVYLFNKADKVCTLQLEDKLKAVTHEYPYLFISAKNHADIFKAKEFLLEQVSGQVYELFVPYEASNVISMIYAHCKILKNEPEESGLRLSIQAEDRDLAKIHQELSL